MLVLSRKQDEDIVIGENIRIRILKIKGNTIRLGIEAPRDIKVIRGELEALDELSYSSGSESNNESSEAEVTIVFGNDALQANPIREQRLALLPFSNTQTNRTKAGSRNNITPPASVSFNEQLPESLQHNRLKQLVKNLTREV